MELKEWVEKNKNWIIYPISVLVFYYFISTRDLNKKTKPTQVENVSMDIPLQSPVLNQQEIEENKIKQEKEEKLKKKNEVVNCLTKRNWEYKEFVYSFKKGGTGLYYIGALEPGDFTWKYNGNNNVIVYIPYIVEEGMTVTVKTNGGCAVYFPY
jgi:hypothetical protein